MPVVIRVLGPLEVVCDGGPVTVQGGKERALLVRLALHNGRPVPTERLFEALWDGDPPSSAEASLRVLVSRVRKTLAAAGAPHVIGTCSPGYLLAADEVDAARFELLARRGRAELDGGRAFDAGATLAEALALWRGDRLAEAGSAHLQAEADRLDEARLTAVEARVDADLACGHHVDVLDELAPLCRRHRLREKLWAQWITALYRCDRQADALATYRELRGALDEELGIDPSPALRRLEVAVLAQDPALAPPPPPRRIPYRPPWGPAERVGFVGRDDELRELVTAWTATLDGTSRTVLVSGEAGIGKSRLLRELAGRVGDAVVLYGRCAEEFTVPYQPFVECLTAADALLDADPRQLAELARTATVHTWPGGHRAAVGTCARRPAGVHGPGRRRRTLHRVPRGAAETGGRCRRRWCSRRSTRPSLTRLGLSRRPRRWSAVVPHPFRGRRMPCAACW